MENKVEIGSIRLHPSANNDDLYNILVEVDDDTYYFYNVHKNQIENLVGDNVYIDISNEYYVTKEETPLLVDGWDDAEDILYIYDTEDYESVLDIIKERHEEFVE